MKENFLYSIQKYVVHQNPAYSGKNMELYEMYHENCEKCLNLSQTRETTRFAIILIISGKYRGANFCLKTPKSHETGKTQ